MPAGPTIFDLAGSSETAARLWRVATVTGSEGIGEEEQEIAHRAGRQEDAGLAAARDLHAKRHGVTTVDDMDRPDGSHRDHVDVFGLRQDRPSGRTGRLRVVPASGRLPLVAHPEPVGEERPRPADPALDRADLAPEQGGRLLVCAALSADQEERLTLGLGQPADPLPDGLQGAGILLVGERLQLSRLQSRRAASLALSWSRIRLLGVTASIRSAPESDIPAYLETPNIACLVRLAITVHTGKVTGSGQELSFQ